MKTTVFAREGEGVAGGRRQWVGHRKKQQEATIKNMPVCWLAHFELGTLGLAPPTR